MSSTPRVSIIVGFYDAEAFLEETIASVLDQSLQDWELLLVDDGSTDGGGEVAGRFAELHPDRIFCLSHPGGLNQGVCASRNLALRHAKGRFVAILDADDVWASTKLEDQVEMLESDPAIGMVCGASRYWRSWQADTGARKERDYTPALGLEADRIHQPPDLLTRCFPLGKATAPCPSDMLLRRDLIEAVGGFEEAFTGIYQMYEDQAFLAKIYLRSPVYVSSRSWTWYRIHPDSCCYRVESSGGEPEARRYYLNWLAEYLSANHIEEPGIGRALARAEWRSRNLWFERLLGSPQALLQQIKRLRP